MLFYLEGRHWERLWNSSADSVTPSTTLQRGLVVPIPHTYILPVMIYRQLDRFLFIIENLFSGQLND
jgi:hypothetical protein